MENKINNIMKVDFANPFKEKGNWYKGVLHVHTTNSDGALSPEEHALIYQKKGYHFLNFADHNKVTDIDTKGRILRRHQTDAENKLWAILRNRQLTGGKSSVNTVSKGSRNL